LEVNKQPTSVAGIQESSLNIQDSKKAQAFDPSENMLGVNLVRALFRFGLMAGVLLLSTWVSAPTGSAQTKEPEFKLEKFYLVLLTKGPNWKAGETPEYKHMLSEHMTKVSALAKSGKVVLAGPVFNDERLSGIGVFAVGSADEARSLASDDPLVTSGQFAAEVHTWYAAPNIMKMPDGALKLDTYYLGFLRKGPKWTGADIPELKELMKAHLANIGKLAKLGKLVIAGPMGDDGDIRGIFVFKTASIDEALQLSNTDPAVKAGHLVVDLHAWSVPSGGLP